MKKSIVFVLAIMAFTFVSCFSSESEGSASKSALDELAEDTSFVDPDGMDAWQVFNDASPGQHETIAGIDFEILVGNKYCMNLSSKRKLTKGEVLKVCVAKEGKDLQFYVDGKNESLADCYAYSIGGVVKYDDEVIKKPK